PQPRSQLPGVAEEPGAGVDRRGDRRAARRYDRIGLFRLSSLPDPSCHRPRYFGDRRRSAVSAGRADTFRVAWRAPAVAPKAPPPMTFFREHRPMRSHPCRVLRSLAALGLLGLSLSALCALVAAPPPREASAGPKGVEARNGLVVSVSAPAS